MALRESPAPSFGRVGHLRQLSYRRCILPGVRLLDRCSQLRQQLSADWRESRYCDASTIVRKAIVQELFSASRKP
ncbi:hypothetical protein CBM2623_B30121 [Cupriavidus taiwanensis]|nr:hypothetical protein CBM2608_B30123 [Cupriavidus taiwanensis]SPA34474.1 hypothetical protein CBM2623_B30121 [Cupriavidus taiwanensis]